MGLWDKLTTELIDIIEWLDESNDTLVWRFPRYQNEIKNGAKLIVRQGQAAIFVREGQIADVFASGMHELKTNNLPILSTILGWKYGFESPFKAEVYFLNLKVFTDNKWGTKNPVILRDPEFGPIRIRAFGNFAFKVSDPQKLLAEIVSTDSHFMLEEIQEQLKTLAVSSFSDALAELKVSVLDMAANYDELSRFVCERINPDFEKYGISVNRFLVENISLPENVEAALDKRSSMGILGNLNQYTQYQTANAIEAAAQNPGGETNAGLEMGMGFAMANQMMHALGSQVQATLPGAGATAPPPLPGAPVYYVAINGQQAGPFLFAQLKPLAQANQLQPSSLVWKEGMAGWEKAEDVSELKSLFSAIPPPLPKV